MSIKSKIKILFLAAEVTPIAKIGGLGDVAGALPKALAALGVDIRLCLPFYGLIDRKKYQAKKLLDNLSVSFGGYEEPVNLWQTFLPGTKIPVYLIEHNYFNPPEIYFSRRKTHKDSYSRGENDIKRFTFFTRAALVAAKALDFCPNVVHANDWHMGLAADLIETLNERSDFFKNTKTLFTIHNLANQGLALPSIVDLAGIDGNLTAVRNDLKNRDLVMMVQGIMASDLINTVSPTYAKEILTKEYGAGLENVLALKKNHLFGILNGIDTDFFNPRTDKLIARNYSWSSLAKRSDNKLILQKKLGLTPNKTTALAGMVTRLVKQKGLELFTPALFKKFSKLPRASQFTFLGVGEKQYQKTLLDLAKKYPNQVSVLEKFDETVAHEIFAGADIFLVPSRFEPCGLTQMIAMRYGCLPVVRATGGLRDTVTNYKLPDSPGERASRSGRVTNSLKKPTGFVFEKFNSNEFLKTLARALNVYYQKPKIWRQLQINGMKTNFSWDKSAKEYLKLYKKI